MEKYEGYVCVPSRDGDLVAYQPSDVCIPENIDYFKKDATLKKEINDQFLAFNIVKWIAISIFTIITVIIIYGVAIYPELWGLGLIGILVIALIVGIGFGLLLWITWRIGRDNTVRKCRTRVDSYTLAFVNNKEDHVMHEIDSDYFLYKDDYSSADLISLIQSNLYNDEKKIKVGKIKNMIDYYESEIKKARMQGFLAGIGTSSGSSTTNVAGEFAGGFLRGVSKK